jgi:hypothetical protein
MKFHCMIHLTYITHCKLWDLKKIEGVSQSGANINFTTFSDKKWSIDNFI